MLSLRHPSLPIDRDPQAMDLASVYDREHGACDELVRKIDSLITDAGERQQLMVPLKHWTMVGVSMRVRLPLLTEFSSGSRNLSHSPL